MLIFSRCEAFESTSESVNGAHEAGCVRVCVHPIQSLGVSILHRIILKRKHSGHACYHSHFPHHRGPELFISAALRDLDKTVVCIDISHAGKLLRHPVLWLQTCTSDQHLIRHTQACLKSNLEQISHDSWILWTSLRSIRTHMRSVWITTMLHRSISSPYSIGKMSLLWVLRWLLSFICAGLGNPSSLFAHDSLVQSEIGFKTVHIRGMMLHSNINTLACEKKERGDLIPNAEIPWEIFLHLPPHPTREDMTLKPWFIRWYKF